MLTPLTIQELQVKANAPLDIDYPELGSQGAVCIGLTIDWQFRETLHAAVLQHTHPEEHARAARYWRPEDSLRHLLGRALLRRVAVYYGGMRSSESIGANTWGKPQPACSVGCNISHAGTQVWVAVSPYADVGIDVEKASAPPDFRGIASNFHPDEIAALHNTADADLATMRCWSRKEAVSKATGMGLSLPLDAYAVDCSPKSSDWIALPPPGTFVQEWASVDLPVSHDYVAALAIKGRCEHVAVIRLATFL